MDLTVNVIDVAPIGVTGFPKHTNANMAIMSSFDIIPKLPVIKPFPNISIIEFFVGQNHKRW